MGLPFSEDSEKFVLGSVLLDDATFWGPVSNQLRLEDFCLDKHRRIFRRMAEIKARGEIIDRVTVAEELGRNNDLDSVGGLSYLVSLDDGLPQIPNVDSYCRIVKEKSTLRRIILLSQRAGSEASLDKTTPSKILSKLSNAVSRLSLETGAASGYLSPSQIVDSYGGIQRFAMESIDPGISWGYPQLDYHLLGIQRGCQYLIGGRTSSGKTAISLCIALNLASRGISVGIQSMEMSKEILMARAICSTAKVPLKAYVKRNLMSDQRAAVLEAYERMQNIPLYIDDAPGLGISDCCVRAERAVDEHGIQVWMVDHMQKVRWSPEYKNEYDGYTAASGAFCDIARKRGIGSIILVQLSRPADKRKPDAKPGLSDIRNTGALEQDATGVIFIHRQEMFTRGRDELRGKADIIIAKSRNGSTADCEFTFRSATTTFTDPGVPDEELSRDIY